ncbi:MAG: hypothetical protein ACP6IU_07550 [Candidatus Asgardarchaeia archaeon]
MSLTPELYDIIVKIVDDRVKDIKVTREAFDKLSKIIAELAEAQKRSEERITRLEQAITRLEKTVAELAEAQKRTQETVAELSKAVGSLSATIGFGLEDIARVVVPGWLSRHENIMVDDLERRFIEVNGNLIEINLYGEGTKNGKKVTIIGECKTRIYESEVKKFIKVLKNIKDALKGKEIYPLMFGFLIHPSAERIAKEHGITLIVSYAR